MNFVLKTGALCLLALTCVQADPQRLIVDTDMGFDVDDVGAVCLANSLHMNGKADVLAMVHDTGCKLGIGGVSAMNHFYGHDNITLGAWKGNYGSNCQQHYEGTSGQDQYLSNIINNPSMSGPVKSYDQVLSGTDAYRKALAGAPNASVNVASIGMPTNLRDLLQTKGDKYSPLSGYDLIQAKVDKIVFMDGGYNFGCAAGNIGPASDCEGSAMDALKMPPNVRLVFSSKGANPDIYTGAGLQTHHPANSPCREAYKEWCCNPNGRKGDGGRLSWDLITVMIAALDVGSVFEKEVNYGTQVTADKNGDEHFFGAGTKNAQTDFTDNDSPNKIVGAIDGWLNQLPGPASPTPPPAPGSWSKAQGDNCYGSRNGQPAHGAKDMENPPSASCGEMTVQECEQKCDQLVGCTGITVQPASGGKISCYRKGDINLGSCDHNTNFDTYVKK